MTSILEEKKVSRSQVASFEGTYQLNVTRLRDDAKKCNPHPKRREMDVAHPH